MQWQYSRGNSSLFKQRRWWALRWRKSNLQLLYLLWSRWRKGDSSVNVAFGQITLSPITSPSTGCLYFQSCSYLNTHKQVALSFLSVTQRRVSCETGGTQLPDWDSSWLKKCCQHEIWPNAQLLTHTGGGGSPPLQLLPMEALDSRHLLSWLTRWVESDHKQLQKNREEHLDESSLTQQPLSWFDFLTAVVL